MVDPQGAPAYTINQKYLDIAEAVLRHLEFVFTLLAFSIMSAAFHDRSLSSYAPFNFLVAANALAWIYSVVQIIYIIVKYVPKLKVNFPSPQIKFLTFIFDQVFTCLLLTSSAAGAAAVGVLSLCKTSCCCSRVESSIAMGFMAAFSFYLSTVISAYRIWKRDLRPAQGISQT